MASCCCADLPAPPGQSLEGVVRRRSVAVAVEEARAHGGLETQRQWADHAIARTTPGLLALFSLVTALALKRRPAGNIPVPLTAWDRQGEPTFSDCLAVVRGQLWRARYGVHSTAEPEFGQFPWQACERLRTGLPLAA